LKVEALACVGKSGRNRAKAAAGAIKLMGWQVIR
jgi:hypothetical protein